MFEKRLYVQKFVIDRTTSKLQSVSQIPLHSALLDLEGARINVI